MTTKYYIVGTLLGLLALLPAVAFADTATTTTTTTQPADPNADVESQVRAYFADISVMVQVARCESGFRQYNDDGSVLQGGTDHNMDGIFQIYDELHYDLALAMGLDIHTAAGNIAYARYLYDLNGTSPWMSSFTCWNDKPVEGVVLGTSTVATVQQSPSPGDSSAPATPATATDSVATAFTQDLALGTTNSEVLLLQQTLNKAGFTIAPSGPGSLGQETNKFGSLTQAAVRSFQCAKQITCGGDEYDSGYGFVGVRTRAALNQLLAGAPSSTPSTPTQSTGDATTTPSTTTTASSTRDAEIASIKAQIDALNARLQVLQAQQ